MIVPLIGFLLCVFAAIFFSVLLYCLLKNNIAPLKRFGIIEENIYYIGEEFYNEGVNLVIEMSKPDVIIIAEEK